MFYLYLHILYIYELTKRIKNFFFESIGIYIITWCSYKKGDSVTFLGFHFFAWSILFRVQIQKVVACSIHTVVFLPISVLFKKIFNSHFSACLLVDIGVTHYNS